jgi:hypothetical protein
MLLTNEHTSFTLPRNGIPSAGQFYFKQRRRIMAREDRLVARCSAAEKVLLTQVAQVMRRTVSDTLRFLVLEKAEVLGLVLNNPEAEKFARDSSRQLAMFEVYGPAPSLMLLGEEE